MSALRILIVEDETITSADIEENLVKGGYLVSGIARNYEEAMDLLKRDLPDMALLDITLSGSADGIEIARSILRHTWMPIVYLTGNSKLATLHRAKETNPAAYLVKPFRMSELPLQIELAIHNFYLTNQPNSARKSDYFLLSIAGTHLRVSKNEIIYIEADGNYSVFHLTPEGYARIYPKKKVDLAVNLGRLVQQHLPANFFTLSRSAVINLDYVDSIEADEVVLRQHRVSIPEGKRKLLLEQFKVLKTR